MLYFIKRKKLAACKNKPMLYKFLDVYIKYIGVDCYLKVYLSTGYKPWVKIPQKID